MYNIIKIAYRNLIRQTKRTLLTVSIIILGVISVLVFSSLTGAFKDLMIGEITDSVLGHIQIHRKGYVSSIDNLPLNKTFNEKQIKKIKEILDKNENIEAYSFRILFGGMLSNYAETTNVKLVAIHPEQELKTLPLLEKRLEKGEFLQAEGILIPDLIARGFKVNLKDSIVLVANNKEGSVNGLPLKLNGIVKSIPGPAGKFGYVKIKDAASILRMNKPEYNEIVIRLKNLSKLEKIKKELDAEIGSILGKNDKPMFEVHTWEQLSPFSNIADMIDLMAFFIKIILVVIVLISIMNVMIMSVYERTKEIGTIAAIGTLPGKILMLFVTEGTMLGLFGVISGSILGTILILILKMIKPVIAFGRSDNIVLIPEIPFNDMWVIGIIILLVAVIGAFGPALKASKLEPIKAIRNS
ncbi:ABC transporter permease [Candidatus Dependentiae bacterium]|nr:ABC transporter permease [Candidatus Dependentiae bacterium]